ncbi:MAG TPA: putative lipid II flippase FtsW [Acidimicrobiia bacterium]|nr:putative lipid II flippase FtsW [Acidimicrobiia bacterium]
MMKRPMMKRPITKRTTASSRTSSRASSEAPTRAVPPRRYYLLSANIAALVIVGVVMVLSASSVLSLTNYGSAWYFFQRQLIWTVVAIVLFLIVARLDYHQWARLVRPMMAATIVLLVAVLVPGIGIYVSGSRRWVGVGPVTFQPSELAKLAILVFAADLLTRRADELHDARRVLRPLLLVLGVVGALVCLEPDLDSTVLIAVIMCAVMVAGGIRVLHLAFLGGTGVAISALLAVAAPYRRARVFTFLNPTADASNAGYQIVQSLIALGSGGISGVGLGASRAKWLFLPNAHTDFIFAVIGEELGLIGTMTVLGLFCAFAILGIRVAQHAPDRFGMLLATGVTVWVVVQAVVNIGAVIGLLPVSGIPLPFVSFGGSSLVVTMIAVGILTNIARQGSTHVQHQPPAASRHASASSARASQRGPR